MTADLTTRTPNPDAHQKTNKQGALKKGKKGKPRGRKKK